MNTAVGGLKRHSFHLSTFDLDCLERIKDRLELDSSALAIRLAIRDLAKRLDAGQAEGIAGRSLPDETRQLPDQNDPGS